MSSNSYRAEIDGLRAVAILLVVLYHASFEIGTTVLFAGGYIGVDVFFVISGYLITRILLREMEQSSFSFLRFYERRARRILPALFVVSAITSIFAWHILMPEPFQEYARSLISTVLFSANIFFLKLDNYTAELIAHRPLLHMWSLGIEEQFYIAFPPLLLLLHRKWRNRLDVHLGAVFLLSLAAAHYASSRYAGADFYLPFTRAWELLGGSLLAVRESRERQFFPTSLTLWFPYLGLTSILVFAITCDEGLPHPSLYTALPVAGTMLIIRFADRGNAVIRLLSSRLFVGLGLISYSLYLWHQPVFALTRVQLDRSLEAPEKLLLILICLILATFSYYYVERPTRNRKQTSPGVIWKCAGAGSVLMLLFGMTVQLHEGFPERLFASNMIREAMYGKHAPDDGSLECENYHPEKGNCRFPGTAPQGYTLLTVGDSHIRTLDAPIVDNLSRLNFVSTFIPLNNGRSLFSFGLDLVLEEGNKKTPVELADYNEIRYRKILEFARPIVITGGRLPLYLENDMFDNHEGGVESGGKFYLVKSGEESAAPLDLQEVLDPYRATMQRLLEHGVRIVLVYPIPEVGWNVPKTIRKKLDGLSRDQMLATLLHDPLTTSHEIFRQRTRRAYQVYDSIPDHPNLLRIYPEKIFCTEGRCRTHDEKYLYYRDDDHLSFQGASMLLDRIVERMQSQWANISPVDLPVDTLTARNMVTEQGVSRMKRTSKMQ